MVDIVINPNDGLPALAVKDSYSLKHRLLQSYVDASHGARRKYPRSCYAELYCGPGSVSRAGTAVFDDGSPLVAWRESVESKDKFSKVLIADKEKTFVEACAMRLRSYQAPLVSKVGLAEKTAPWAAKQMDPYQLHLVFLDPFGLAAMPFSVFQPFFPLKRVDFIVHVSASDLQRNLDSYLDQDESAMDAFAPGWRDHVQMRSRDQMRGNAFWYWVSLLEAQRFKLANERVLVRGPTRQPLYWLLNFSRHPLAAKLWDDVAYDGDQPKLL